MNLLPFLLVLLSIAAITEVSAARVRPTREDQCNACKGWARGFVEGALPDVLAMQASIAANIASGSVSAKADAGRVEELVDASLHKGCRTAAVHATPALTSACDSLVEDYGVEIGAWITKWSRDPAVWRENPRAEKAVSLELPEEEREDILRGMLRHIHSISKALCGDLTRKCKKADFKKFNVNKEIKQMRESHDVVSQTPAAPVVPPLVSTGEVQHIVGGTVYPFLIDSPGWNTENRDILFYHALPAAPCYFNAPHGMSPEDTPHGAPETHCADTDPNPDAAQSHENVYPVVKALAQLTKGFDALIVAVYNARANTAPAPFNSVKAPAMSYHPAITRLIPKVASSLRDGRLSFSDMLTTWRDIEGSKGQLFAALIMHSAKRMGDSRLAEEWQEPLLWTSQDGRARLQRVWREMVRRAADYGLTVTEDALAEAEDFEEDDAKFRDAEAVAELEAKKTKKDEL